MPSELESEVREMDDDPAISASSSARRISEFLEINFRTTYLYVLTKRRGFSSRSAEKRIFYKKYGGRHKYRNYCARLHGFPSHKQYERHQKSLRELSK